MRASPNKIWLVIGPPTKEEWKTNVNSAEEDCAASIKTLKALQNSFHQLGFSGMGQIPAGLDHYSAQLRALSESLLDSAIELDLDAVATEQAAKRIIASDFPMKRKGEKGAKDAIILEHLLAFGRQLQSQQFNKPCIFVSSNTKDFAEPKSTDIHQSIASLFSQCGLEYAISLEHAEQRLHKAGYPL